MRRDYQYFCNHDAQLDCKGPISKISEDAQVL